MTFLAESRTVVPAYHVLTHTSRITNTVEPQISTSQDSDKIGLMLQDFIPQLLPTAPLPLTTTYTTITITKVSTITSDVTSDITITLGGRPVKTEYVVPTTMVCGCKVYNFYPKIILQIFTDLHISRSAIVN